MTQFKRSRTIFNASNQTTTRETHDGRDFYSFYANEKDKESIDFWGEDRLYGKITPTSEPIFPRNDRLRQIKYTKSNKTIFLLDFVADAWEDLVLAMRDYANKGRVVIDSPWANLLAYKGYSDVGVEYDKHFKNILFPPLSDEYLAIKKKNKQVTDFQGFLKAISPLFRHIANSVPITKSGFIQSNFCPVRCSGLVVEVGEELYSEDFHKAEKYYEDNNFPLFLDIAKEHGFMIDKNIPWRLVANLSSPAMKKRIAKYINPEDFFLERVYYYYSYRDDIENLKVYLFDMYETFRSANPYVFDHKEGQNCTVSTSLARKKENFDQNFGASGSYAARWSLKTYYLLRTLEMNRQVSSASQIEDLRLTYDILDTHGFYDALYYLHTHLLSTEKKH